MKRYSHEIGTPLFFGAFGVPGKSGESRADVTYFSFQGPSRHLPREPGF